MRGHHQHICTRCTRDLQFLNIGETYGIMQGVLSTDKQVRLHKTVVEADALRRQLALAQREAEGLRQEAVTLRLAKHEAAVQTRAAATKRENLQQQVWLASQQAQQDLTRSVTAALKHPAI